MTHPLLDDQGFVRSLEVHRAIEAIYPRIEQAVAYFRSPTVVDPIFSQPPGKPGRVVIDQFVCALAIKAATTKRAVLTICELGDGSNAIALARVLLENACLLEWLIRGEGRRRLEAYVKFTSVGHERIVQTIERHKHRFIDAGVETEVQSDEYHRAVWRWFFGETSSYRPTWEFDQKADKLKPVSVQALFREIAGDTYSFEHDTLYGLNGSEVVHSGPLSLDRIIKSLGQRQTFVLAPMTASESCTVALATSNSAMFLVLDSLTQYMGLDLSAELEPLKARAKSNPYAPSGTR